MNKEQIPKKRKKYCLRDIETICRNKNLKLNISPNFRFCCIEAPEGKVFKTNNLSILVHNSPTIAIHTFYLDVYEDIQKGLKKEHCFL